jgi:hypothetical protein
MLSCTVCLTRVHETPRHVENSLFAGSSVMYHFKNVFLSIHMLMCSFRWNSNTGKHTTFMQYTEHLDRHFAIPNSMHRKPSVILFNSSNGTSVSKAVNIQHISIFGLYEGVWYCSQHSYFTINSHNGQLMLYTDSHASYSSAIQQEGRTVLGTKSKLPYSEIALPQKPFGMGHMYIYTFFFLRKMIDSMTFQNIDLSSWDRAQISVSQSSVMWIMHLFFPGSNWSPM